MDGNYLQLNFVNLITVVLMVAIGVMLIGLISGTVNKFIGG